MDAHHLGDRELQRAVAGNGGQLLGQVQPRAHAGPERPARSVARGELDGHMAVRHHDVGADEERGAQPVQTGVSRDLHPAHPGDGLPDGGAVALEHHPVALLGGEVLALDQQGGPAFEEDDRLDAEVLVVVDLVGPSGGELLQPADARVQHPRPLAAGELADLPGRGPVRGEALRGLGDLRVLVRLQSPAHPFGDLAQIPEDLLGTGRHR